MFFTKSATLYIIQILHFVSCIMNIYYTLITNMPRRSTAECNVSSKVPTKSGCTKASVCFIPWPLWCMLVRIIYKTSYGMVFPSLLLHFRYLGFHHVGNSYWHETWTFIAWSHDHNWPIMAEKGERGIIKVILAWDRAQVSSYLSLESR